MSTVAYCLKWFLAHIGITTKNLIKIKYVLGQVIDHVLVGPSFDPTLTRWEFIDDDHPGGCVFVFITYGISFFGTILVATQLFGALPFLNLLLSVVPLGIAMVFVAWAFRFLLFLIVAGFRAVYRFLPEERQKSKRELEYPEERDTVVTQELQDVISTAISDVDEATRVVNEMLEPWFNNRGKQ